MPNPATAVGEARRALPRLGMKAVADVPSRSLEVRSCVGSADEGVGNPHTGRCG
jgi:hypothetical protein